MTAASNAELLRSINDLHSTVGELRQAVGRTEGKIDTFVKQMEVQDERAIDLEERTRKVENGQHRVGSFYGLAGGLLSFVGIKIFGAH